MTTIRFFVPERPFVKQRPRFGRGRTWTPAETVAAEEAFRHYARKALPEGFQPMEGPLRLTMEFRFDRAKRQQAAARATDWHFYRPDWENLAKLVDALNPPTKKHPDPTWPGVWLDDGQVASARIEKRWADAAHPEGTTVQVEAL